jgi:hypothetical protein
MIILNKETTPHPVVANSEHGFVDMFRKEIDAYCAYKEWEETTEDSILEMALEEIMMDEYLHAKFLRDYLMEHNQYPLDATDEYEKKFLKMHKKFFY